MRNRVTMKKWTACLIAAAAASCTSQNGDGNAGNEAKAGSANAAAPAPNANAAAPATNVAAGGTASASYQASGTEPFWALTIGGGQMTYTPMDGAPVSESLPAQTPIANGYRYQGAQMTVEIVHTACDDVAEINYPDTVKVIVGGQTVEGCGR